MLALAHLCVAVILLHMFMFWPRHKKRGFDYTKPPLHLDTSDLDFPYDAKVEDAATEMAGLYGVSSVSMRGALYSAARRNDTSGLRLRDFMYDRVHPNDNGQAIAGHLVVSYLEAEIHRLRVSATAARPVVHLPHMSSSTEPPPTTSSKLWPDVGSGVRTVRAAGGGAGGRVRAPQASIFEAILAGQSTTPLAPPAAGLEVTGAPRYRMGSIVASTAVATGQPLTQPARPELHVPGSAGPLGARSERTERLAEPPADLAADLPPPYYRDNSDDLYTSPVVCVRGAEMLEHTLRMDGWRFVIEGGPANPKPGLRAHAPDQQLDLCWRPPGGGLDRPVAFKLGYLKTYGAEMGTAALRCSGVCECHPTTLSGLAAGRPKRIDPLTGLRRTSLHHVENVVLRPAAAMGARTVASVAGAGVNATGCCIVSIRTLPPSAEAQAAARAAAPASSAAASAASFKILSFFVGKGTAGTGRLHQQSIVMAETT